MIHVSYIAIREDAVERVRGWLDSLSAREAELTELARAQTVSHEIAHLIDGQDGPVLVYAIEVSDLDAARSAMSDETHQLAAEWQRVISECSDGHPSHETLLEHAVQ